MDYVDKKILSWQLLTRLHSIDALGYYLINRKTLQNLVLSRDKISYWNLIVPVDLRSFPM
jgi:hypothetical protein